MNRGANAVKSFAADRELAEMFAPSDASAKEADSEDGLQVQVARDEKSPGLASEKDV